MNHLVGGVGANWTLVGRPVAGVDGDGDGKEGKERNDRKEREERKERKGGKERRKG